MKEYGCGLHVFILGIHLTFLTFTFIYFFFVSYQTSNDTTFKMLRFLEREYFLERYCFLIYKGQLNSCEVELILIYYM